MVNTKEQIDLIEAALKKTGVAYADIRYEMTDHIAMALEEIPGNFELKLKHYIAVHRKDLKRANRKFMVIAYKKSFGYMFAAMVKPCFLIMFTAVFAAAMLLNNYIERADVVMLLFFNLCLINGMASMPNAYKAFIHKDRFSAGWGFGVLPAPVFFLGIGMLKWQKQIASDAVVLLIFTAIFMFSVLLLMTTKHLNKEYNLRYGA